MFNDDGDDDDEGDVIVETIDDVGSLTMYNNVPVYIEWIY
jgi:hypothetical protein